MATHAIPKPERLMIHPQVEGISNARLWAGRALTGLAVSFFIMDGGMKLFKPPVVVQSTAQLGFPESTIVSIGIALLVCTLLYVIPRTSVWGAILLSGYLGGAVASKVRIGAPVFDIAFALMFALFVWGGLVLRNKHLQQILFAAD